MKRLFLILLMSSLFLAACGGEEAAETAVPATTAIETAVPKPTVPSTESPPTKAPPTMPPATDIPPTDTPPTPETAPESGNPADNDPVGTSGSTACDHPYLPIRTGATWTYTDGTDTFVWEVVEVRGDELEATAVVQITVDEIVLDYEWECTAGTGIAAFDFGNLSSTPLGIEMSIERISAEGQFILPADQLQPGVEWKNQIENIFRFSQEAAGQQIEVTGHLTVSRQNKVLNANPVTFDGTAVDGIQIEQSDAINTIMDVLGNNVNQTTNMTLTYTLGRGIGIVRQDSVADFSGETPTLELISYFIP